jgi:hypothetical protein
MMKRSEGIALLIEFFFPGVGSFYGDHAVGAAVTWGCILGGFVLVMHGIAQESFGSYDPDATRSSQADDTIVLGFVLAVGGRIFGLIDAYSSTSRWNARLRQSLGFQLVGLTVTPVTAPSALHRATLVPTLQFRF